MKVFDQEFADAATGRLRTLEHDAKPAWGRMTRGQLIGHLNKTARYTLGEGPEMPFKGNFKSKYIFRHVILSGLKPIPHNIRMPRPEGVTNEQLFAEAPLETLEETIAAYLQKASQNDLPARTHPFFGMMSAAQWQRFHRLHFVHHLQQFQCADGL